LRNLSLGVTGSPQPLPLLQACPRLREGADDGCVPEKWKSWFKVAAIETLQPGPRFITALLLEKKFLVVV
jgi:hypothetical protein